MKFGDFRRTFAQYTITMVLISSGVEEDVALVAAEYLVQEMQQIAGAEVCNPVKFAELVESRGTAQTTLVDYKAAFDSGSRACAASPCQNSGACRDNLMAGGFVCDCPATHTGDRCEALSVQIAAASSGQPTVIQGVAYDQQPYGLCTVYLDLNRNGTPTDRSPPRKPHRLLVMTRVCADQARSTRTRSSSRRRPAATAGRTAADTRSWSRPVSSSPPTRRCGWSRAASSPTAGPMPSTSSARRW